MIAEAKHAPNVKEIHRLGLNPESFVRGQPPLLPTPSIPTGYAEHVHFAPYNERGTPKQSYKNAKVKRGEKTPKPPEILKAPLPLHPYLANTLPPPGYMPVPTHMPGPLPMPMPMPVPYSDVRYGPPPPGP